MISTFLRQENKYILDEDTYRRFLHLICSRIVPDAYKAYTVRNLYYDTEDLSLIRASVEKPCFKEKIRIRSYGIFHKNDPVFVEIKRKFNGIVYKRRIRLPYSHADRFLRQDLRWENGNQILKEFDYFTRFYTLVPKVYLAYEREAFTGIDNGNLRITFDRNIRARNSSLRLDMGNWGTMLLQDNIRLMEIKTVTAYPLWLSHSLTEFKIYPTAFSKYGTFYKQQIKDIDHSRHNKKEPLCLQQY